MPITDWPQSERPREKLLERGAAALSDAELLAIFLRTGLPGRTAVDVARELLAEAGGLRALIALDHQAFCAGRGLGDAAYAVLQAARELGRRCLHERLHRGDALSSPESASDYVACQLRDRRNEAFAALFLDTRHRLIRFEILFEGTIDGAAVHPRAVVQRAMVLNAAAVIFAHNHPSGVAEPSSADRSITRRLQSALALVDVRVLDHLVVGDPEVVSFANRGLL